MNTKRGTVNLNPSPVNEPFGKCLQDQSLFLLQVDTLVSEMSMDSTWKDKNTKEEKQLRKQPALLPFQKGKMLLLSYFYCN